MKASSDFGIYRNCRMTEKDFKGNAEALDDLRNREENCRHGILDILFYKARYLGLRYDLFLRDGMICF